MQDLIQITIIQFIPNMDGFPNGRRLEDDVTRIELQAVSGIVLAVLGLWYDDFTGGNPVTPNLLNVLNYKTGVEANDTAFKTLFPFEQTPWAGTHNCGCTIITVIHGKKDKDKDKDRIINLSGNNNIPVEMKKSIGILNMPEFVMKTSPNPFSDYTTIQYQLNTAANITIAVYDAKGNQVKILVNQRQEAGSFSKQLDSKGLGSGVYLIKLIKDGTVKQTLRVVKG